MVRKIFLYELKKSIWRPMNLLLVSIMVFQGIWYTKGMYEQYQSAGVFANSAASFYQNLSGGGILLIIIVAIVTTSTLYKDRQYNTHHWLYTYPISEKSFFVGRFLSAFVYNILIALGYLMGMLLTPYVGIAPESAFGPMPIRQMLYGFLVLMIPNLFMMTALVFAAVTAFRSAIAGYVSVFLLTVLFLVMISTSEVQANLFHLLADPFGYVPLKHAISYWSDSDKNILFFQMEGYLLWNKLIWLSIASLLFFYAYRRFSFVYFYSGKNLKKQVKNEPKSPIVSGGFQEESASIGLSFKLSTLFKNVFILAWLEYKNIVRPMGFKVVLGIVLFMIVMQNLLWNATYHIGPQVPVTSNYTLGRLTFGVFIIILLMVWSGELFFKDQTFRVHAIIDALPIPIWTLKLSKLIACFLLAATLAFAFISIGVCIQILQGGLDYIDWGLYAYDLLGYNFGLLSYILMICLTFFLASLTNHRFLTHMLSVGLFFCSILTFELGIAEQLRFGYGFTPGAEDYSNVNGYGIFVKSGLVYFFMWALLAVFLVFMGVLFWTRGVDVKITQRFSFQNKQLSLTAKLLSFCFLAGFFLMQWVVYTQVNEKGSFTPSEIENQDAVDYEKKYRFLSLKNQPKYDDLVAHFDYFPKERRVEFQAQLTLKNTGNAPIDKLYLQYPDFVELKEIRIDEQFVQPFLSDELHRVKAYLLPEALDGKASVSLHLQATKQYEGLSQGNFQADVTYNGSFGSVWDFLPTIGYQEDHILQSNRDRKQYGLPILTSKMADIDDAKALLENPYREDALFMRAKISVGTISSQRGIASGDLVSEEVVENRRITHFEITKPSPADFYIGSGVYEVTEKSIEGVRTKIFYHPKHHYNLQYFQKVLKKSLIFLRQNASNYPFNQLNIFEIPFYQKPHYSFYAGAALSEKEGWLADFSGSKEQAYLHLVLASQLFQNWIQQNVAIANVRGADNLQRGIAEAFAIFFVAEYFEKEVVESLIEKKIDYYLRKKNEDYAQSPDWRYVDENDYIAVNKSAVELYRLLKKRGGRTAIRKWIRILQAAEKPLIFKDFLESAKEP